MANRTAKNLLSERSEYNRYYGNFRGVDFSNDHTQIRDDRLAYSVNMYRDYQSGQGKALETIPGFRRRVKVPGGQKIYGIHHFMFNGNKRVLIHSGNSLYLWHNYPLTLDVEQKKTLNLDLEQSRISQAGDGEIIEYTLNVPKNIAQIVSLSKNGGENITENAVYDPQSHTLKVSLSGMSGYESLTLIYKEGIWNQDDVLFSSMNNRRSVSFVFNNKLYLIDGKNYLCYNGECVEPVADNAYIPTTYINIIPAGDNQDSGAEHEQRNALQPKFAHTFIADGVTTEFHMNEQELDAVVAVRVYGEELSDEDYSCDLESGTVTFITAPSLPEDAGYPKKHAGIEIIASKQITSGIRASGSDISAREMIEGCTVAATFDERVFLSGNTNFPNLVFYCGRNFTGYPDPSYFGILNNVSDGVGNVPITGMVTVADTLMVLKGDTQQDGSVYFHSPVTGDNDITARLYTSVRGLSGIGCLGVCGNFLDDPVFISRLGLEGVGQLSVRYERAIEHRSSLIDAKLVNMPLSDAVMEEWNGYLLILTDGKIFMADSRQKYVHETGVSQYEWYFLDNIGIYEGQYLEYRYAGVLRDELAGTNVRYCTACGRDAGECTCASQDSFITLPVSIADSVYVHSLDEHIDMRYQVANPPAENINRIFKNILKVSIEDHEYEIPLSYTVREREGKMGEHTGYDAFLCNMPGNMTGGVFKAASTLKTIDDNLFFGTENGFICSFNFDMRDKSGEIAPTWYSFDGRTIFCGCATKMDSCGIPHLNKSTVKKSTVIKTKTFSSSAAKIKVRTNKKPYSQIARISNTSFSFGNVDFSDFTFSTTDQSLFSVKEKEKKWVEKQYYIYSDEYLKPFALYYISFRYYVSGRYKE